VKKPAQRIALALGSFVFALVIADLMVDRWFPVPHRIFRADPVLLHALVPDARRVSAVDPLAGGGWVTTAINSRGFRGHELAQPKRDPRVLVLGDSLVLAEQVALEKTFVERLRADLGAEVGSALEVVNAGVTGYGPDQECLQFEREVDALAPDLVVLVLCAHNDCGDLVRNKIFSIGAQGELVLDHYTLAPSLVASLAPHESLLQPPALWRALESCLHDRKARAARDTRGTTKPPYMQWYLSAGPDEYSEFVRERNFEVRTLFEDYYDADLAIHPEWESSVFKRRLMKLVLARIQSDCAKHRVPLVAVVVPSSVDLCPRFEIHVDPAQYPTWSPTRLTDTFVAILSDLGVHCVDLCAPFQAAGPEPLYLGPEDFHWSAAGQELAARLVADAVRAWRVWPPERVH
jgi:hypothetical protein